MHFRQAAAAAFLSPQAHIKGDTIFVSIFAVEPATSIDIPLIGILLMDTVLAFP